MRHPIRAATTQIVLFLGLAALLALIGGQSDRRASAQPADCVFTLGFKQLRDQIPEIVGDCIENEQFNVENGNAEQRTSGGLLVWRKADNWTAFTNGSTTWINGPLGVVSRPNGGPLYPWEAPLPCRPSDACANPAPDSTATPRPTPAPSPGSGIEGRAWYGPTCPVSGPGLDCDEKPYQGLLAILRPNAELVSHVQTDVDGSFRVALASGTYLIRPEPASRFMRAQETRVEVSAGQFTRVELHFDTGIR